MILCKKCYETDELNENALFDYWQRFDYVDDFYNAKGRCCDMCGKDFDDGERVVLIEDGAVIKM